MPDIYWQNEALGAELSADIVINTKLGISVVVVR